jgi:tetratricopeptide (TPR) repeat protein
LRLGVSIRNVISPKLGYGGESDKYPTTLRLGASYSLPSDWLLQNSRITLVSDFEWLYDDIDRLIRLDRRVEIHKITPGAGQYFGTEFQYRTSKMQLSPRFGFSHVYDEFKFSTGLGVSFETSGLDFQFDFAQGFHEELADDQRISLTIGFGGKRDATYYFEKDYCKQRQTKTNLPPKVSLLHVLSEYPDNLVLVMNARDSLASTLDTLNRMRYLEMFIDLSLGNQLHRQAREKLEMDNFELANWSADKALDAYDDVRKDMAIVFSANDLLNNAESHAIVATTESDEGVALKHWQRVGELAAEALKAYENIRKNGTITVSDEGDTCRQESVASTSVDSLRAADLQGLSAKATRNLPEAIKHLETALTMTGKDSRSMRLLSRYELAGCLMESGQPDSSLKVLKSFFDNPNSTADSLADHYPRFPVYTDRRLSDDALYMVAEYYRSKGLSHAREALLSYGNVCRFYPDLDKCRDSDIETHITELIKKLSD